MTVRPGDIWKIAALLVLIAGVAAYGVWSVLQRSRPPAPAPQTLTAGAPAAPFGTPAGVETTPRAQPGIADLDANSPPPPASTRDPFRPPVPTAVATPPQAPAYRVGARSRRTESPPVWAPPPLPQPGGPLGLAPAEVAAPPAPAIELKGVIAGDPAIAVVAVEGQTTYRQEGELVAGGWSVARISEAGVVMKRGRTNRILPVGHAMRAADPKAPDAPSPPAAVPSPRPTERAGADLAAPSASRPGRPLEVELPAPQPPTVRAAPASGPRVRRSVRRRGPRTVVRPHFAGRRL